MYVRHLEHDGELKISKSDLRTCSSGVPQGSVLGPVLFLIYIDDIHGSVKQSKLVVFADDSNQVITSDSLKIATEIANDGIKNIKKWCSANSLKLNETKTCVMHFHNRYNDTAESPLIKNSENKSIPVSKDCKFLGIYITDNLDWGSHVNYLIPKLARVCYQLRELRLVTNYSILKMTYHALFESLIRYGIIFWGFSSIAIDLFKMQKRAIRFMHGKPSGTHCRDLFINNKLMTLPSLFIYETILFVYNNRNIFVQNSNYHMYPTRSANSLSVPVHKSTMYSKGPYYQCLAMYNRLPSEFRSIMNRHIFKAKLKNFLIEKCCYSLVDFSFN